MILLPVNKLSTKTLFILGLIAFFSVGKINAQCPANAEFAYYVQSCSTYQFTDMSTVSNPNYTIVQWDWDFGDGGTSSVPNPLHSFTPGSTYNVQLTITADSGGVTCTDDVIHQVVVSELPTVYFSWDPDPTCIGDATAFSGTSSGNIVSWQWQFGDGGTSTIQNPNHLYVNTGTYDVTLTVTDVNNCTESLTQTLEVVDNPDVDFTIDPDPACLNQLVTFSGTSSSSISSWFWELGDGTTATTQNVIHIYTQSDDYNVTLTVTSSDGCTNSITKTLEVKPLPNPDFQHDAPVCLGDSVHFINYSVSPNGYIETYYWNFGDGNSVTINYPANPDVAHLYSNTGTFQVTLTVTDSEGCIDSISKNILVNPNPVANFIYSSPCDGEPVDFTDMSSPNSGSQIVEWYWNFGDPLSGTQNTSTIQNPTHVFTSTGTFGVRLVVTNVDGCTDTIVKNVTVNTPQNVDFTADRDTACINEIIQFTGIGDSIVSWYWEFGDGGTNIIQNPQYAYMVPGTYNVTLTVIDINGCTNSVVHPVNVKDLPIALFDYSSPACTYDSIYFTDFSTSPSGYITTWHWYFGDGTDLIINFPDNPNVAHLYTNATTYTVSLVVTDSYGCIDSTATDISIVASPIAAFDYDNSCYQQAVEFTDQSVPNGGGNIVNWYWDFGDPLSGVNNYSTLQNPTHIFTDSGTFIVTLQATNATGCWDTISQQVIVYPLPNVNFTIDNDSTCVNDIVSFTGAGNNIISWFWEFGDGGTGYGQSIQHIYTSPGVFTVSLTIEDGNGCINSISQSVYVNQLPVAQYTYNKNCFTDTTIFTDQSFTYNSMITTWLWNFDDPPSGGNNTSSLQNPSHLFTTAGTYNVMLIITDLNGCQDSIVHPVQVFDKPVPDFSFEVLCNPYGTVQFIDESTPGGNGSIINDWWWEIDKNYYTSEQNPSYTYTVTDTCYPVTLTVTDLNMCSNSFTDTVCIIDPLVIDFTANRVCYTMSTFFDASYTPSDDSVISWQWEFGDGSVPYISAFDTVSYVYPAPGSYQVVLTATNINNCTSTTYTTVIVDPLPSPDFSYNDAVCDDPTMFTDLSNGNGYNIISWFWNFGDYSSGAANYSTIQNPSHVYPPNDSTYYATLTVTNLRGCVDSITMPVTKGPCVIAGFTIASEPLCQGHPSCFIDNSYINQGAGQIINWLWEFGDGNTYSYAVYEQTVCHAYANPGFYNVKLTVEGSVNGSVYINSYTLPVYVNTSPTADYSNSPACGNTIIEFTDESNPNGIPISVWHWDFGNPLIDDDTSNLQNPTYKYSLPSVYDVELIVTNDAGCSDTIINPISVFRRPMADFEYAGPCINNPTFFYDESDSTDSAINEWLWDFGNIESTGDTSILEFPYYYYNQSGTYNVTLVITDGNNCRDTLMQTIQIHEPPISSFVIKENYDGLQGKVLLENLSTNSIYYFWDFDNGDTSYLENPVVDFYEDGLYNIMLIAYNQYDCADTIFQDYEVFLKGLYIPNAFAPLSSNPDIKNFKPKGYNIKEYQIDVYSKWGTLVWSSTKLDADGRPAEFWDGTYKGNRMPQGAYVWKARAVFRDNTFWKGNDIGDGNSQTYGTVTLIH